MQERNIAQHPALLRDAPAFTGISVERAKRVKSEGPGISVEREKRVKSEVRLACGWPAAVKHARKAPQNPVPTALSTHFVLYTHTHTRRHTRIQHRRNKQQHTRTGLSVGLVHAHTRRNRSRNTRRNRERREQGCQQFDPVRSSSNQFDPPAPCL